MTFLKKISDCLSIHFITLLKQPQNSGRPATLYNGDVQFRRPN